MSDPTRESAAALAAARGDEPRVAGEVAPEVLAQLEDALPGVDEQDLVEGRDRDEPDEVPPQHLHNPWWVPI